MFKIDHRCDLARFGQIVIVLCDICHIADQKSWQILVTDVAGNNRISCGNLILTVFLIRKSDHVGFRHGLEITGYDTVVIVG